MFGNLDRAMKALLIVGGLNWLAVAVGKFDFVAARRFGQTHPAARVVYGVIGGSALYTRDEAALKHGAGVETETPHSKEAYAGYPKWRNGRPETLPF